MGHSEESTPDSGKPIKAGKYRLEFAEMEYRTWRRVAAQILSGRDELAWGIMHENAWIRFYVKGLNPEEAADRARVYWHNDLSFSERLRRK